jgi:hypothetical protein
MGADLAEEARTQVSAFPESINALKGLEQISLSSTPVREETPARGIIEKSIDGLKSELNLMTSWPGKYFSISCSIISFFISASAHVE